MFQSDAFPLSMLSAVYLPWVLAGLLIFCTICFRHLFFPTAPNRRSTQPDRPVIILCGPTGSGKTKLWSRLVYGSDSIETSPTMVSQSTDVQSPAVPPSTDTELEESTEKQQSNHVAAPTLVTIVDTPAHPRLRAGALATHLVNSTNVVFVIDTRIGLGGKALRDTAESLNLVLSYLLLFSYRRAKSELPKLAIYLNSSSTTSSPSLHSEFTEKTIPKINSTLNKELNRRRIASTNMTASTSFEMSSFATKLECVDSYLGTENVTFLGALGRRIKALASRPKPAYVSLPDDECELMRLLDEEDDQMIGLNQNLNALEQYEALSGSITHWLLSTSTDPYGLKAFWAWLDLI